MGYTHYWERPPEVKKKQFRLVVRDFRKLLPVLAHLGIALAGWDGTGKPLISDKEISFNGEADCGHRQRLFGISWPTDDASGLCFAYTSDAGDKVTPIFALRDSDVGGRWFGGCYLRTRTCDGNCANETFLLSQSFTPEPWQELNEWGCFSHLCRTAFKPYDLAVNCALLVAAHHLGREIRVSSDGTLQHWRDAMLLCQKVLGYGADFALRNDPPCPHRCATELK